MRLTPSTSALRRLKAGSFRCYSRTTLDAGQDEVDDVLNRNIVRHEQNRQPNLNKYTEQHTKTQEKASRFRIGNIDKLQADAFSITNDKCLQAPSVKAQPGSSTLITTQKEALHL